MDEKLLHLRLQREEPVNRKRPGTNPRPTIPSDIPAHGRYLKERLSTAIQQADTNLGGFDERRLIRFTVQRGFDPEAIRKISPEIEFVSQEDETVVVGFASQAALAQFEARLTSLANGEYVTNVQVLYALEGVDGWGPEDRKAWALRNFGFPGSDTFLLDVELWPTEDNPREQTQVRQAFERWLTAQEVSWVDRVLQPGLSLYRVQCNLPVANDLLHYRDVRTLDLPPSFRLERALMYQDIQTIAPVSAPPENAPGIVVLDSGLVTGHPLLAPAVGDTKSFLPGENASDENGHGTHVAGLALYGDFETSLRSGEFVPTLRLFSGRILNRDNENNTGFIENHIAQAVHYFATQYGCKVFNLSFGDSNKPYKGGHLKGLAFTLDTLSRDYNVLFVVSAGNHRVTVDSPQGLVWRDNYPAYLLEEGWEIIDPATALNVLTVGSLARHEQTWNSQRYSADANEIAIARHGQPSPFTRSGASVDGAIKPELVAHGGNWAINTRAGANHLMDSNSGLGVISTHHGFASPNGNLFVVHSGTSMAAPQVAHLAAAILTEYPDSSPNLLRALLCAHAIVPLPTRELINQHDDLKKVCGYGEINSSALKFSLEDAATLITTSSIENKRHHFYEIPIPDDFITTGKRTREIAVALAYTPPVRSTRIKYRATRIDFHLVAADNLDYVVQMFNNQTAKEDYNSIPEISGARVGYQLRSKGTVQADVWQFRQFNAKSVLKKKRLFVVITRNDFGWGDPLCGTQEEYALVVSLRDKENQQARLYTQLKNRLQARMPLRARV